MMILLGISIVLLCAFIQSSTIAAMRALLQKVFVEIPSAVTHVRPHILEILVFSGVLTILFLGILAQVFVWACVFVLTGEVAEFSRAFYFSLVNFTTLGYGDIVLSPARAVLGPMEASNGILMLGLSTSFLYSVGEKLRSEQTKARQKRS